jgi:hypothetical protein
MAQPTTAKPTVAVLVEQKGVIKLSVEEGLDQGTACMSTLALTKSWGCLGSQSLLQTINPSHRFLNLEALNLKPQESQMATQSPLS